MLYTVVGLIPFISVKFLLFLFFSYFLFQLIYIILLSNTCSISLPSFASCGLLSLLIGIGYSNGTEWSTIQGVIARVISKADESEVHHYSLIVSITNFGIKNFF